MAEQTFVGRTNELQSLQRFLDQANAGQAQIVFVAGEAGAGKTALVHEFVRRAQAADANLVAAVGECNAQTGAGDPYLPFRQVLTTLTGAEEEKQSGNKLNTTNATRLKEFVRVSSDTLLDIGPDLVGIFVPGASLALKLATKTATHLKLSDKLAAQLGKSEKASEPVPVNAKLDQEKIFEQYTNVLQALSKAHPLVLIFDDLQWADSASLNLLFHLARQLKESRVLLVGTFRPDDVAVGRNGERHPIEPILNELKRYNGEIVIDLGETRANEGRSFVDALIDAEPNRLDETFRAELFARTDGHPLFTVELLRTLQERGDLVKDGEGRWIQKPELDWSALPARVEGVIEERLARLAENLREELTVACVMGLDFTAQVIARVQKVQERELVKDLARELDKRYRLVEEQGEKRIGNQFLSQYRFTHALFQQFLYNELRASERRLMHGDVGTALEALYEGHTDEIAPQLARHFQEAGDDDKALAYLIRAGDDAFRVFAQNEAVTYYTRALELNPQGNLSGEQLAYLYTRRGRALELNSQFEAALNNYSEMLAVAHTQHDRTLELAALLPIATLHSVVSGLPDAVKGEEVSNEALKLAEELGDHGAKAKALWNLMLLNMYLKGDAARGIEYGEQSLALARALNLDEQIAYLTGDLGVAYCLDGQLDKGQVLLAEGQRLWLELGNLPMYAYTLIFSMSILMLRGQYQELQQAGQEGLRIGEATHSVWHHGSVFLFESFMWMDYGEPAQAIQMLESSIHLYEQENRTSILSEAQALLFWYYVCLGAHELAAEKYRTWRRPLSEVLIPHFKVMTLALYALYEIATGQLGTAEATLRDSRFELRLPGATWKLFAECQLAFAQGKYPQTLELVAALIAHIRQFALNQLLPDALFLQGKTQLKLEKKAEAKESFAQARTAAETLGSRRMLWQILAALAELEEDAGQTGGLRAHAGEIVSYIVEHMPTELRGGFLNLPEVQELDALRIKDKA